jgi:hypothetical protein
MGILRGALKSGIAVKAAQVAKRELSKPENRAKMQKAYSRFSESRKGRKSR